jgi:hypothetical protein
MAKAATLRAMKRQRTVRLARLLSRAFYLKRRHRDQEMYNLICDEMVSLGGVYVKFLQGVLLNGTIMKRWTNPNRMKIFENLDTEPLDIVQILRHELPPQKLADILLIQPEPFAAGSFGQVYFGQHKNGKQIIIKVLRPQVRELLRNDLRLLSLFTKRFTAGEYKNISVKMDQAIKEFREATLRETDYVAEANFAHELFEVYKNHAYLVIPETYLDLCTTHLIVQDYVPGISAVDLLKLKEQGEDPKAYVQEHLGSDLDFQLEVFGIEALLGVFNLPRIQGDPHPGNIRFLPENKVGMIDFGISATTPQNKAAFFGILDQWNQLYKDGNNFVGLFEQFMRFFMNDLYKSLRKISSFRPSHPVPEGETAPTPEDQNLTKELGRVMQEILKTTLGTTDMRAIVDDGRVIQIFNNMVNKGNRFGLVMRIESSEILRAAQTYMTLVESLGRRKAVLPRVFSEVVAMVEQTHPDIRTLGDEPITITQALEIINGWLERVAMRDPLLFDKLIKRIRLSNTKPAKARKPARAPKVKTSEDNA